MDEPIHAATLAGSRPIRLVYVLGTFPSVSETFILREITELRRRGMVMLVCALRRPPTDVVHQEAVKWLRTTCYRPAMLNVQICLESYAPGADRGMSGSS